MLQFWNLVYSYNGLKIVGTRPVEYAESAFWAATQWQAELHEDGAIPEVVPVGAVRAELVKYRV